MRLVCFYFVIDSFAFKTTHKIKPINSATACNNVMKKIVQQIYQQEYLQQIDLK